MRPRPEKEVAVMVLPFQCVTGLSDYPKSKALILVYAIASAPHQIWYPSIIYLQELLLPAAIC